MTCAYATWDGSYVLGALSPPDRERFEQHLEGCPACAEAVRELAGLPGLLARVDAQAVAGPPEPVPGTLLPRLVREVRAERRQRRRRALVVGGLAAAAVVGVVSVVAAVGAGVWDRSESATAGPPSAGAPSADSGTPARAMEPVGDTAIQGWLTVAEVPWGTRLTLRCTYPAAPGGYGGAARVGYAMVVRTRDGREQQVATWTGLPGRSMQLDAATASGASEITAVEVRTSSGRPVLRLSG